MENFVKEFDSYFQNFSFKEREKQIDKVDKKEFDIVIIGGGITGAGIAREAAIRGYSFCLVDKEDFAFGTSSKSSKLAHGGFRYLAQGEIKLVRESTTERNWLASALPNLVRPLGFVVNAYEGGKDSLSKIKIAVFLYDLISNFLSKYKNKNKHRYLTADKILEMEPEVKKEGLLGGAIYYDTNVDDSRLTIETIKDALAIAKSKKIDSYAFSYCRFIGFDKDENNYKLVYVQDRIGGLTHTIRGKVVINATGIWIDETLEKANIKQKFIRPTKGVHLIVKRQRLGNNNAFGLRSIDDGRFFFVIRRENYSYIGTTDTDYNENLDEPVCEKKDCDYLLNTINYVFPKANITYKDIISAYAGVRPLILEEGKSESAVSRKHIIYDHSNRFITIGGGKLTIFRKMAEDTILFLQKKGYIEQTKLKKNKLQSNKFKRNKRNISKKDYLIALKEKIIYKEELNKVGITRDYFDYCIRQYGKGAFIIFDYIIKNLDLGKRFIDDYILTKAEVVYHFNYEMALTISDILERRTEINCHLHYEKQRQLAEKIASFLIDFYGFNNDELKKQVEDYCERIDKNTRFLRENL